MKTFEQYHHTIKSAKILVKSAFENVPDGDIDFKYVNGQLHVIVYTKTVKIDDITNALSDLQQQDVLGSSIEVIEVKANSHVKIVIDEKLLENYK